MSSREKLDQLTREFIEREYRRYGVAPGDHVGYFLARCAESDAVVEKMLKGRTFHGGKAINSSIIEEVD